MDIAFWRWWTWFTWQYPCFLLFRIFIINLFFIASYNSMQKWFLFASFKQQFTNSFLFFSLNSYGNQFSAFWTSPRLCRRLLKAISVSFNVSDNCLKIWQRSSSSNACKSSSSNFCRLSWTFFVFKARWNTRGTLWSAREIASVALSAEQERHTGCVSLCLKVELATFKPSKPTSARCLK